MKSSSSHSSTLLTNRATSNDHEQSRQTSLNRGNPEWQKNTIRVCGNWSEQLSSKGKVYFYNSITEVSQWQKPSEWTLPDMTQSELHKILSDRRGGEVQPSKRPYSSAIPAERTRNKAQESSSPKRQKLSNDCSKNLNERLKIENATSRVEQTCVHRSFDSKSENHGHGTLPKHVNIGRGPYVTMCNTLPAACEVNTKGLYSNSQMAEDSSKLPSLSDQSHRASDSNNVKSNLPNQTSNSESLASKVASLLSQANRSPLVTASSTCQRTNSDPQPSSSQSSSPCPLRHRPSHYTPQQPVNSCPKRLPHDLPSVSSASSLLPDPVSSRCTNSSVPYERRLSLQNERPTNSPQRTTPIKANQVLRNLISRIVDRPDRQSFGNSAVSSNRTPPVNVPPGSQQNSVANLLSILEAHVKPSDGRSLPVGSSPAANRNLLNGLERNKEERLHPCPPPSSDGTSIPISPSCPRSSPSPRVGLAPNSFTASDFRNLPQKSRPSPLASESGGSGGSVSNHHHQQLYSHNPTSHSHYRRPREIAIPEESEPNRPNLALDSPEVQKFVDPVVSSRFLHPVADSLESEAQRLLQNFDRLHSVLYSELSGELKKLRALVCISEAKLKIHQKRKESLQELMDTLESRKTLPLLSSPDPPV